MMRRILRRAFLAGGIEQVALSNGTEGLRGDSMSLHARVIGWKKERRQQEVCYQEVCYERSPKIIPSPHCSAVDFRSSALRQ